MANYLKATKLELTKPQYEALIEVKDLLASGKIKHEKIGLPSDPDLKDTKPDKFNMLEWRCGTIACIGGFVDFILQEKKKEGVDDSVSRPIAELFYPLQFKPRNKIDFNKITVPQAVQAIENFLTTGKPEWERILL